MFNVGDKVVRNEDSLNYGAKRDWIKDHPYEIDKLRPHDIKLIDLDGWFDPKRFSLYVPPVPADDGVIRLRCVEGLRPHLRVGDVYSVKIEGNTYYTLNEIPGKKYKKARFERLVGALAAPAIAIAEPRELKAGDVVVCVNIPRATFARHRGGNPWGAIDIPVDNPKLELTVTKVLKEHNAEKIPGFMAKKYKEKREGLDYIWPLDAFIFADGSPIKGGAVVKDIPKEAPRPVKDTDWIKEGDEFIVTSIDREWAAGYNGALDDSVIGKKFKALIKFRRPVLVHHAGIGSHIYLDCAHNVRDYTAFPIKDLVWANKDAITNIPKPAVEEPKLQNIYEYAAKHMKKSDDLCSWIIQRKGAKKYDEQVNWPCYAGLQHNGGPVEQLIISMYNKNGYITTPLEKEQYDEWLKYVIEESPFRVSFLTKTAEEAKEKHLLMDCSRARDELLTSATAMRDGYEHKERLPVFTFFVEEGYSKHTAYLMAYMLHYGNGKWSLTGMGNGHTNMDGTQDIDEVCKFFRVGYNNKLWAGQPKYNVTGGGFRGMYRLIAEPNDKNSMRKFAQSFAKAKGEGWGANYTMDEASAKKLADAIEAKIKGQPEEKKKVELKDEEIPF